MTEAVCVTEASYTGALTRGKRYTILARDDAKAQVRVRADTGRLRWFPLSCFDLAGRDVPVLTRISLPDPTLDGPTGTVEVDVELSDGQRRWCFFVTPEALLQVTQAHFESGRLLMYGVPHMIVVSTISREVVEEALHYIDRHNELIDSTLPLD